MKKHADHRLVSKMPPYEESSALMRLPDRAFLKCYHKGNCPPTGPSVSRCRPLCASFNFEGHVSFVSSGQRFPTTMDCKGPVRGRSEERGDGMPQAIPALRRSRVIGPEASYHCGLWGFPVSSR